MPDEVREHLTRDQRPFLHPESLQILQIHSSMTLLLFSSPHSSSTGFRSEVRNGHSRSLLLCSVTHLCVCFSGLCLDYCTFGRVGHFFIFYQLVKFYILSVLSVYHFIIFIHSYIHSYSYKGADILTKIYIIILTKFKLSLWFKML